MPPRVFVNDVSAYTTRHLSKFLSEAAVGGTQAEDEDDDDEDGEGNSSCCIAFVTVKTTLL